MLEPMSLTARPPSVALRPALPPPAKVILMVVAVVVAVAAFAASRPGPPAPSPDAGPAVRDTPGDTVDVGFATDMLDHHQQALQMALLAVDKATTTPVRSLALRMVASQQLESGRFLQFLEERGLHQGDPDRTVMIWMGMALPRDRMPGLASADELLALTNAEGPAVDRLFLDLMIRHHEGGLPMAEYEAHHGRDAPLRGVAGRIVVMQRREIADMEGLRRGLG